MPIADGGASSGSRRALTSTHGSPFVIPDSAEPLPDPQPISRQAVRLHALGVIATLLSDRGGVIGRSEAERLADHCGAVLDEVVDAGLWLELELGYRVIAGSLTAAVDRGSAPPAT